MNALIVRHCDLGFEMGSVVRIVMFDRKQALSMNPGNACLTCDYIGYGAKIIELRDDNAFIHVFAVGFITVPLSWLNIQDVV